MGKSKSNSVRHEEKKPFTNGKARRGNDTARQRLIAAKNRRLKKLIELWLEDESGYDEETGPWLQNVLAENRRASRGKSHA